MHKGLLLRSTKNIWACYYPDDGSGFLGAAVLVPSAICKVRIAPRCPGIGHPASATKLNCDVSNRGMAEVLHLFVDGAPTSRCEASITTRSRGGVCDSIHARSCSEIETSGPGLMLLEGHDDLLEEFRFGQLYSAQYCVASTGTSDEESHLLGLLTKTLAQLGIMKMKPEFVLRTCHLHFGISCPSARVCWLRYGVLWHHLEILQDNPVAEASTKYTRIGDPRDAYLPRRPKFSGTRFDMTFLMAKARS
jgi:hypothetical protein